MDNDGFAVPAVQCSVIQYCSDNNKVGQEENSPVANVNSDENEPIETASKENSHEKNCNSEELESKNSIDACTDNIEIINNSSSIIEAEESCKSNDVGSNSGSNVEENSECKKIEAKSNSVDEVDQSCEIKRDLESDEEEDCLPLKKNKNVPLVNGQIESESTSHVDEYEDEIVSDSDEEIVKPRRRGRCKKNPELIPPHLAPDIALGYRMLLKFLETPQFSVFLRPGGTNEPSDEEGASSKDEITCLNQIKKKFDENVYKRLADFIGDVRSMLSSVYMTPRNPVAVKRALRLEQVLEQRIAQLPNYLRPQCSLVLSEDEISNSPKKIRINKGGGFVSLLLERADKIRTEKDREKRKVLAEERKHLKEEQDKDVQDWEKNVLLKDHEEEIKSMWELPQIGHFIHLCANILNIGDVSQYEVERMLLMPQCSETLDLLMTALLSNSLVRAKLDRTPTMPYSIWLPLVRTRVNTWYRSYQREYGNPQKVFEETGVEPEFWPIVGTAHSPLDYFYFHEIPLIQRVWILKTLCDVDFVRKKTVYDNIRQQVLEELQGNNLGVDRHGNRYIHFPQFGMTALRIYRQSTIIDTDIIASELVESQVGFDVRKGEITLDKVFRDIWDVGTKNETPKKKRGRKKKNEKSCGVKVKVEPSPAKSLRISARAKRKIYVDSSDSDFSDTDLATLKTKLSDSPTKADKTFISLSVFRLPREKVKPVNMKKSYYSRKLEREEAERLRQEELEATKDKLSGDEESNEPRLEDEDDDDAKDNFTVKNLQNLKMVLKKGSDDNDETPEENEFKYTTPSHLLPDSRQFYCVVDSVDGLRQLITQFASDDNDLEIINRSTLRSGKSSKLESKSPSCEVQLIERLQKLEDDLDAWEMDYIKTSRAIRDKLYKEYNSYQSRPSDFVHPNEAYWHNLYEEPAVPETPTVAETVEPIVEVPPPESDIAAATAPLSPLGGLRPRTRTRQQQQVTKLPDEDLDDEDYDLDSPESDDNWEMPVKRKKRSVELRVSVRQSKRPTRKPAKMADFSGSDVDDGSQKPLFWSPRSTDPSEELNWETNRQKILEKHNSPRKVVHGDIESEMSEVENALKTTSVPKSKNRIYASLIPGNRKPYYSTAQLKAMANTSKDDSDNEVDIISAVPAPKRIYRYSKAVMKKSASTQSSQVIDLDPESSKDKQTVVLQTQFDEHYITDGSVYIKIDYSYVQELMKNQSAVKKFAHQLDLNKKIQIVKKKFTQTSPVSKSGTIGAPPNIAHNRSEQLVKMVAKSPRPTIEQNKPSSNLRFVRPQNVPNPVQIYRPTQRVAAPNQPNYMYVQAAPVRPGLVQLVRPSQNPQPLVAIADKNSNASGSMLAPQNILQHQIQDTNNKVEYVEILTPTSTSNQVEIIQVQSSGKQQQYVQVSQGSSVLQTALGQQNILRLSTTAPSNIAMQATPSYVRLASTGQIVQISPTQPTLMKSQVETNNSGTLQGAIATNVIQNQTSSANQVTLLQVQGLPGEPISYIPVQTGKVGNFVQIQSPQKPIGQLGTIVQMASPQRQSPQVGRLVQLQSPTQPQGVVLQQTSTQGTMVQMQMAKPIATNTSPRPQQSNIPQTVSPIIQANNPQNQPRQQTTLVQVYGSPRMQTAATQMQAPPRSSTTATQMQGSPRLQTIVRNVQNSLQQDASKLSPIKTYSAAEQTFMGSKMQTVLTQDNNKIVVGQDQLLRSVGQNTMTSLPQLLQTGNGTGQMVMVQVSQPLQQGASRPSFSSVSTPQIIQQPLNIRQRPNTPQIISPGNVMQLQEMPRPMTNVATQNTPRHTLVSVSHPGQLQNNVRPGLVQTSVSRPAGTMITTSQQTNIRPYSNVSGITQNTSSVQTVQQMVPRSSVGTNTQVRSPLQRPMGSVYRVSAPRATVTSNVVRASGMYSNAVRPVGVPGLVQFSSDAQPASETSSGVKLANMQAQNVSGQVVRVSAGSQILQTNANQFGMQTSNASQVRQVQSINVVQSGRLPSLRTQYVHVPNSGQPVQISIQETDDDDDETPGTGTYRIVSETDHLVRLLTSDPKTANNFQSQPIIVKAAGSRPAQVINQTVTIDDGDEDLEIVEETVSRVNDGLTL